MADEHDAASDGPGLLGGLGFGLWVLGLIVGFVVAVEYDPAAADFRDDAVPRLATVAEVTGEGLAVEADGSSFVVALDADDIDRFVPGDPVSILAVPGDPDGARLDRDVPVTPRRATDLIAPLVILLLGAVAVSSDPDILYPSRTRAS